MPYPLLVILVPVLGACTIAPVYRYFGRWVGWWSTTVAALASLIVILQLANLDTIHGAVSQMSWAWLPELNINVSLYVDGLGLIFCLLIACVGTVVLGYSNYYLSSDENLGRFHVLMLLFMASMLGIVLSDNLILLFLFWEATTFTSFMLVGYWDTENESRYCASKALYITVFGGLAMLGGFVLLYVVTGTFEFSDLLEHASDIKEHSYYWVITVLILLGAFTKSAQFPFQNWLPTAMVAPTPVSAYLHSAAMVKAGIFLMLRMFPVLGGTSLWIYLVTTVGIITMCYGAYHGVRQFDIKKLLAYSTVSQLGLIVALIGMSTPLALFAAVFHVFNHSLFKGALFLLAGVIDHLTGTRVMNKLGGLARAAPVLALLTGCAALSMAGLPPFNGFLSKELFLHAATDLESGSGVFNYFVIIFAVGGSVLTVVYSMRIFHGIFLGPKPESLGPLHKIPFGMIAFVAVPTVFVVIVGIYSQPFVRGLIEPASLMLVPNQYESIHYVAEKVSLWHGVTLPLILSVCIVTTGFLIYGTLRYRLRVIREAPATVSDIIYDRIYYPIMIHGLSKVYLVVQSGYLRHYVMGVSIVLIGLVGYTVIAKELWQVLTFDQSYEMEPYEIGLVLLLCLATVVTACARDRLSAVIAFGVVGGLVTGVWIIYSAPDLALTQLLIEAMSLVLFVLVFVHGLPFSKVSFALSKKMRDIVLSACVGGVVTLLMWIVTFSALFPSISPYFLMESIAQAGGHNVVNVIIVDFRGFDTLGEITVVAVAAIALFSVHKLSKKEDEIC